MKINKRQKELLETEAVAVGTLNKDGSPNVIAIGYARVVSLTEIVITDNFMKVTNENIKRDSRVCLAVWTKDWEEGYKFVGKAEYQAKGKWAKFVKEMKENKDMPAKGAIIVKVSNIYKLS
ncbi:MAG TPA: pyridoxamine 5'-phosphate oxidase family protein [Nevskiaceae bacterium]|nr:pyridoxamine 5'-phosphate oxidase family protein [Nevskiaceae bacterium]